MVKNDYHQYVIKNGELVAKFDEMYRECDDPWNQSLAVGLDPFRNLTSVMLPKWCGLTGEDSGRVIELGCGTGHFTKLIKLRNPSWQVMGLDVSATAVKIANSQNSSVQHLVVDVMSTNFRDSGLALFKNFKPHAVIMCQLSWYILPMIRELVKELKKLNCKIIHQLTFYPENKQQLGLEYFTSPDTLREYLGIITCDLDLREIRQGSVSDHLIVF
jgi:SAM-dependent methyltransferase